MLSEIQKHFLFGCYGLEWITLYATYMQSDIYIYISGDTKGTISLHNAAHRVRVSHLFPL